MKLYRWINLLKMPFNMVYARLYPARYARSIGVRMGDDIHIYGSSYAMFSSEPFLVELGSNVHITHAKFLCHDGGVLPFRALEPTLDVTRPIKIGCNTFIGYDAIILAGVEIGDNCVVGAGAVVAKSIPAGSVVVGNPARIVKQTDDYIEMLKQNSTGLGAFIGTEKRAKYFEYFGIKS